MRAEFEALPYRPCVGLLILNAGGRIFAGRRIDNQAEAWQMPQGGVDPGETPHEAAVRELREETGLTPEHVRLEREHADWLSYDLPEALIPNLWGGRFRGQTQRWFAFRLIAGDDAVDIATEEPEFSEWRWMSRSELMTAIVPFKRDVYDAALDAFADLVDP